MSDFRAHIVGDLDLSEARSQMESFLNEYKDKKLKITPEINTSQAQKAGEQAAQAVSKGMEKSAQSTGAQFAQAVSKGASKSKKGKDLFGFSEEQQKVRKKIAKDAELLQESYPGLNKKDAKKDARGYYTAQESERKKAEQAAQKASEQKMKDSISAINEESKARERAEKQNYQARKKNADAIMKESLANIEKQSKNKADIIKAQASGKDSTVDILKEQRKQLRSEGRKLQKEMRSYNDIYSPSERSQILRNKRMESSYDVDMARATVSDKVAASLKVSSSGSASSSNSTKSGNNKIRYNVETGNYAARSSKMEKQLSVYSGQDSENVAKATIALKTYNEELGNLQNHFNGSKRMNGSELAASFERMTKAGDTFKNTLSQINDTQSKNLATGVAERGANKIAAYYEANSKAVMKDISEVYDDLTDKKKAELLEKLAGKNRGNQIAALIQGFQSGQVQKAYEDSINSEGSAQQEQDRWLNSIEAKQQQFQAAMQNLATSTISSDFFKGLTDTGTGALNVLTNIVDKFGLLNTAAIGLGIFQGKNNSGESTWESPHAFFKTTYAA